MSVKGKFQYNHEVSEKTRGFFSFSAFKDKIKKKSQFKKNKLLLLKGNYFKFELHYSEISWLVYLGNLSLLSFSRRFVSNF